MTRKEESEAEKRERCRKATEWAAILAWAALSGFVYVAVLTIIFTSLRWKRARMIEKEKCRPLSALFSDYAFISPIPFTDKDAESLRKKFGRRKEVVEPTIRVLISSYRDPDLCLTLSDMYSKAMVPGRVFCGVVQQNDVDTDPVTSDARNVVTGSVPGRNLDVVHMSYKDAKGPTYSRAIGESLLYKGEDYVMMTDSHMRFEPGWDSELISMILKCPNPEKTVITQYPQGFERKTDSETGKTGFKVETRRGYRYQKSKGFNADGIPEFESVSSILQPPKVPHLTQFWAACFSFSKGTSLRDVPYAPFTENLFFGEEILMSARYFTHGYEIRSPCFSVVYHKWNRGYRKTYWEIEVNERRDRSILYVKRALTGQAKGKYGLGTKRSIEEYQDYVGLDFRNQKETKPRDNWRPPLAWNK